MFEMYYRYYYKGKLVFKSTMPPMIGDRVLGLYVVEIDYYRKWVKLR